MHALTAQTMQCKNATSKTTHACRKSSIKNGFDIFWISFQFTILNFPFGTVIGSNRNILGLTFVLEQPCKMIC